MEQLDLLSLLEEEIEDAQVAIAVAPIENAGLFAIKQNPKLHELDQLVMSARGALAMSRISEVWDISQSLDWLDRSRTMAREAGKLCQELGLPIPFMFGGYPDLESACSLGGQIGPETIGPEELVIFESH